MKIVFVENRYKTYLYESIANKLIQDGHEIYFLVQNHSFKPSKIYFQFIIKYPKNLIENNQKIDNVEKIIKSDRQINHFKKKSVGYFYYYDKEISDFLNSVSPNIVFGESTAFHELLTIENCKKKGILYLNPSTCRYPSGRFSFYKYDTLKPFKGSGKSLNDDCAIRIINQIVEKKVKPDYMKVKVIPLKIIILDKFKKTLEFLKGERFNTPNPFIKVKLEREKKQNIERWDSTADLKVESTNKFTILFPLQMQPEANIDVWGNKYRNQTELIKKLSLILPDKTILYVKPNPKSKYELSSELYEIVSSNENIKYLHHTTKMVDILSEIDLVITITGTIAIECIFGNKPVITLQKTLNNEAENCKYLDNINNKELKVEIDKIRSNDFPKISLKDQIIFLNRLNETSYKGIVSDPFNDKNCTSEKNIQDLYNAFYDILKER
jgi:hypothetical protein